MSAGFKGYLGQSLARAFALTIPFAIVLAARSLFPQAQSVAFFRLLADAVLITAVARLGVDIYIARCKMDGLRVIVSKGYIAVFHGVSVAAMVGFLLFGESLGGVFRTLGVSALVVQAALLAEIARARGYFTLFYLLKSPMNYIAVTIWVFAYMAYPMLTNLVAVGLMAGSILLSLRLLGFEDGGPGWTKLFPATLLSILIIAFSWKETLLINRTGDDMALEIVTFYTRFKIMITFLFTVHNARVPNLMREAGPSPDAATLRRIMRGPMTAIAAWSVAFIAMGMGCAWYVDPGHLAAVAVILMSSLVLVAFGNLIPVLNALDRQPLLMAAHVQALASFALVSLALIPVTGLLMAVAIAALLAQAALGLHLWIGLRRLLAARAGGES